MFGKVLMRLWEIYIIPKQKNYPTPADIYLLKVNNRNIRASCEICSKLTVKTPLASFWCFYRLLLTYFTTFSNVSIVNFKKASVGWDRVCWLVLISWLIKPKQMQKNIAISIY